MRVYTNYNLSKMMRKIYNTILYAWYTYPLLFILLLPFALIYRAVIALRRFLYARGFFKRYRAPIKVIVVGNFVVGGTGKTPMVIALAQWLKTAGFRPGIVTRGYGGASDQNIWVTKDSDPSLVGDEPVLIATHTGCLVVKNKHRAQAAKLLAKQCDIIISDDGLQHYTLIADIKIAMLADKRWLRNPFCLPAGPWREPRDRLDCVDFKLESKVVLETIVSLQTHQEISLDLLRDKTVHAVCAIAAPWRFFSMLQDAGISVVEHAYPDHYLFTQQDMTFPEDVMVLVTEKDAIKCKHFDFPNVFIVKIKAVLDPDFCAALIKRLAAIKV